MRHVRAVAGAALLSLLPGCATSQSAPATSAPRAAAAAPTPAPARTDTLSLRRVLDSIATAHRGVMGYAVRNLDTGEQLSLRGDETFPTASLIKVPVLVALYDLVEKGQISLTDKIVLLDIDKVGGSGLLQFLHNGLELTLGDAAVLMITISDNTATNLILDRIGIRRVWSKMEALGLGHSKVHSGSMTRLKTVAPDSSAKYGLGVTTPNEMAQLFALLAQGKAVSPRADSTMLALLERAESEKKMMRYAAGVRAAHKSGETDAVRTECALFYLRSRVVACVLTKSNEDKSWTLENSAEIAIARLGEAIINAWK
ncbi:MAG TPA: serine hydrolase [Gemmatimonadaceae bacterium]|nr:serine hydrolase [Gemmatimonadaceae bacterium]